VKIGKQWSILPLPEAFWFQEGPGVRNWQFTASGVKLLNVANIEKGGTLNLAKTDRHLDSAEVAKKYSHFLVDAGDLVIASSGISFDDDGLLRTRGAFIRSEHLPLCLNTSTIRFKAIDGVSDLRFLRLWLDSQEFRSQITKFVTGTAQQNFGPSHLKAIKIALPPLSEQRRIAEVLDRAEALRAKRRAALAQLDSLTQAIFIEMFGDPATNPKGWPTSSLAELGPIHTGKTPPTNLPDMFGGEIPFATPGDLDGRLSRTERTLTIAGAEYVRVVRAGSALVGCIGNIGKMAKTLIRCAFNQQINAVEWNGRVHDDYGITALAFAIPQMMSLSSSTVVPILNKSGFMKVELRVPPLLSAPSWNSADSAGLKSGSGGVFFAASSSA
jgi:restriction endonuclease S subunit